MPTKRKPIRRELKARITPMALDIFARMEAIQCSCLEGDYEPGPLCPACQSWYALDDKLRKLIFPNPTQHKMGPTSHYMGSTFAFPGDEDRNPYPSFSKGAKWWYVERAEHLPMRVQLYKDLRRALDERERGKR